MLSNYKYNQNTNNNKTKNYRFVSDNYIFVKKIGSGSFGEVYLAEYKDGGYVAAKVEDRNKPARIRNEYRIYTFLHKNGFDTGLPKIYEFIQTPDYNMMFMQLLGPNLEDLLNKYDRKFNLPTVMLLAEQLITLLEELHKSKYLHRDIKPNNFLIGRDENSKQIFMMDFGLSKKYINGDKHIQFKDKRSLIGTARYASINMHMGIEPTRRDDLESVGYMLVYFLKGKLPWQGIKRKKGVNHIEAIGEVKICTSIDVLCDGLPDCYKKYIEYCRKLLFEDNPDYKYMKTLFRDSCIKLNITPKYQWCR